MKVKTGHMVLSSKNKESPNKSVNESYLYEKSMNIEIKHDFISLLYQKAIKIKNHQNKFLTIVV